MTLTNLTDLPDDVLKTEFPMVYAAKIRQQQMQNNSSRTNVFLDQDNNQFYIQKDGSDRATRYDLLNINKAIQRPQFTDDAKLDADYMIRNWGALDDENIFDSTNHNWNEIRDYLQAMTRKINAHTEFLIAIGPYLDKLANKKDVNLSEIVAEGVDGYYKVSEIDKQREKLQSEIDNIQSRFPSHPDANGYTPPSYVKGADLSDDDPELDKIEHELGINN